MDELEGDDKGAGDGVTQENSERSEPGRKLFRASERDASSRASATKEGRPLVNPKLAWGPERRAKIAAYWAAERKAKAERQGTNATPEELLEVKGEPPSPPKSKSPSKEDVEGWAGLILLGHTIGAAMLKVPELGISKSEADQLSIASMNVMRHYSNTILSEKSQDWIKFGMVASMVYVPRLSSAKARSTAARKAKASAVPPGQNSAGGFERKPEPPEPHYEEEISDVMQ